MRYKVVVIGRGYSGRLGIIRSLAELDCDITVISLLPNLNVAEKVKKNDFTLDAYSRYVSRVFYSESYNKEMLLNILMNHCVDKILKTFIFPDNDFSAACVDEYRDRLKEHFFIPHIHDRAGAVTEWMDKVRQKELAKKTGLDVANANLIEVYNRQFSIPDTVNYPCFVKPLLSVAGGKSALKRCNTKEELQKHIEFVASMRADVKILVEDFKAIDKEYAVLGFSDGKEVVIPGMLQLLNVAHGSHFGVAMRGRVFPCVGNEELINKFKRYVKEIGFYGIFDIDFYESAGVMYFCELNLRFGGSGYAITHMGVNLPVMMIRSFLGDSISDMNKAVTGEATYFNERMALDDWYVGYMTIGEFRRMQRDSEIRFVDNDDDKLPYEKLARKLFAKRVKKTIKHLLRRL